MKESSMNRKIVLLLAVIAALVTGPAVAASADSGRLRACSRR
jgi:hypothetical protein